MTDVIAGRDQVRKESLEHGTPPASDDLRQPRMVRGETLVAATLFDLGEIGTEPVSQYLLLAYDDLYSIEFLHRRLLPYWKRDGRHVGDLLLQATDEYHEIIGRAERFDAQLMDDVEKVGLVWDKLFDLNSVPTRVGPQGNRLLQDRAE